MVNLVDCDGIDLGTKHLELTSMAQEELTPAIRKEKLELDLFPHYPVFLLNSKKLAETGKLFLTNEYRMFEMYLFIFSCLGLRAPNNPYASAIENILPDKAILLLNDENKFCTTYSEDIGALTLAGIRYGGLDHEQAGHNKPGKNDRGYLNMVPVSKDRFPLEKYKIASSEEFHKLSDIHGGEGSLWSGKYLVSHLILGLMKQYLYHDSADMISVGNFIMNTSSFRMPHTHYKSKKQLNSQQLEINGV